MTMDLGEGFTLREGKVVKRMPELKAAGKIPIPFDLVLQKQFDYPDIWEQPYLFTGDAILTGKNGDGVIDKASALLYVVHEKSILNHGALVLEDAQYEAVRYSRKAVHLSAAELTGAHGKGYVRKNGVWQPENAIVGYVWEVLTDGRNLMDHAELVSQRFGVDQVMCLYFDQGERKQATLRSWVLNNISFTSNADGCLNLDIDDGYIVGVAPEMLESAQSAARDPALLRTRLEAGLEQYVARPQIGAAADYVVREAVQFAGRE